MSVTWLLLDAVKPLELRETLHYLQQKKNSAVMSMNPLLFAGLYRFQYSLTLRMDTLISSTEPDVRAPVYECDTDSLCGRTTRTHRDVGPHSISVFLFQMSQTGLFLELSEEHLWVEEDGNGFGHFQQLQQDENQLNKSKLGLITLHLAGVTPVTNSNEQAVGTLFCYIPAHQYFQSWWQNMTPNTHIYNYYPCGSTYVN